MSLRATVLELPARWNALPRQLEAVEAALASGPPTDLVLLPEAALSGYLSPTLDANLARFAESLEGPTAQALRSLAMRHGMHLVGPLIERAGEQRFNALIGFTPTGERWFHYRKRNPWYPETWATPGALPFPRATIHGLRVTAAICFDVHFLEETAAEVLAETDLLLFPSAWVSDDDSLPALLQHLSRRFDLHVLNANWGPGSPAVQGQGGSLAFGRGGELLARHTDARQPRMDVLLSKR